MLKTLALTDFSSLIGSPFQVQDMPGVNLQLDLTEVVRLGTSHGDFTHRPEAFSLLFKGPHHLPLVQKIYRLQHSQLGEISLFLVPVAGDVDSVQYEAIFN